MPAILDKVETNRVNFKIPWLARCVEIDDDLLVFQTKLFDRNVGAVCPRATVVGVEGDFVSSAAHLEGGDVGTSQEALSLVGGMTSDASNCSVLL